MITVDLRLGAGEGQNPTTDLQGIKTTGDIPIADVDSWVEILQLTTGDFSEDAIYKVLALIKATTTQNNTSMSIRFTVDEVPFGNEFSVPFQNNTSAATFSFEDFEFPINGIHILGLEVATDSALISVLTGSLLSFTGKPYSDLIKPPAP